MVGATHDGTSAKAGAVGSCHLMVQDGPRAHCGERKAGLLAAQPPSTREAMQSYELPLDGIRLLISSRMLVARAMRLYLARKSAFAC